MQFKESWPSSFDMGNQNFHVGLAYKYKEIRSTINLSKNTFIKWSKSFINEHFIGSLIYIPVNLQSRCGESNVSMDGNITFSWMTGAKQDLPEMNQVGWLLNTLFK